MSDKAKMEALSDGVYAWMAEHPLSVHDAIEDGVRKAVEAVYDARVEKAIADAISATVVDHLEAARTPPPARGGQGDMGDETECRHMPRPVWNPATCAKCGATLEEPDAATKGRGG